MIALLVGLWFICGIVGSALLINLALAQRQEIDSGFAWLAFFGLIFLLVVLAECIKKACKK